MCPNAEKKIQVQGMEFRACV